MANDSIQNVVAALKHIADARVDGDDRARIVNYAPDSSDAEYDGHTEPGSAWDEECASRLAAVSAALPGGWSAEWSDDDVVIDRDEAAVLPDNAVIVETMPEHLRGSHRAARNWGVYPHNGAHRSIMSRSEAEVAVDGDEYDHIVREATEADMAKYEVCQ